MENVYSLGFKLSPKRISMELHFFSSKEKTTTTSKTYTKQNKTERLIEKKNPFFFLFYHPFSTKGPFFFPLAFFPLYIFTSINLYYLYVYIYI